jgi:hypothetical protein
MCHQILQASEGIAGHASTGSLDQEVVPVLGSGDGLRLGVDRWLRQAGKHGSDKSIQQRVERLLATGNADIVTGHAFKASRNQGFGFTQLGSTVQLVLNCRPDECARTGVAARFDGLVNPNPIFLAQSDSDPGPTCRACVLSHESTPSLTKRIFATDSST